MSEPTQADTLPAAIKELRHRAGSHDKLAAELGTSRQRVIQWEKGAAPSARYRAKLEAMGVPSTLFESERGSIEDQLELIRLELREMREQQASMPSPTAWFADLLHRLDRGDDVPQDALRAAVAAAEELSAVGAAAAARLRAHLEGLQQHP